MPVGVPAVMYEELEEELNVVDLANTGTVLGVVAFRLAVDEEEERRVSIDVGVAALKLVAGVEEERGLDTEERGVHTDVTGVEWVGVGVTVCMFADDCIQI